MKALCTSGFYYKKALIKKGEKLEMSKDSFAKAKEVGCVAEYVKVDKRKTKTTDIQKAPKDRQMKPKRRRRK